MYTLFQPKHGAMWVVLRIISPFWSQIMLRHHHTEGYQKWDSNFVNYPCTVSCGSDGVLRVLGGFMLVPETLSPDIHPMPRASNVQRAESGKLTQRRALWGSTSIIIISYLAWYVEEVYRGTTIILLERNISMERLILFPQNPHLHQ